MARSTSLARTSNASSVQMANEEMFDASMAGSVLNFMDAKDKGISDAIKTGMGLTDTTNTGPSNQDAAASITTRLQNTTAQDKIDDRGRGSTNIERYLVVKYKKWSIPFSIFILTLIGFSVAAEKRRGGTGVNLAFGICVAMVYVFFDKIFGVLAQQSDLSPLVAVWLPNIIFGVLAIYLVYNAKK